MNDLTELAKDRVMVEDKAGAKHGPFRAVVSTGSVVIFDANAHVEEGDTVCRPLPNGREDRLLVTQATFYQEVAGIPSNWQLKTGRASTRPTSGHQITINNAQGVQIGDYNTQSIVGMLEMLARRIEESGASDSEKTEAKGRLASLLRHPLITTLLGAAGSTLLSKL